MKQNLTLHLALLALILIGTSFSSKNYLPVDDLPNGPAGISALYITK